jgi:hypothetical protein
MVVLQELTAGAAIATQYFKIALLLYRNELSKLSLPVSFASYHEIFAALQAAIMRYFVAAYLILSSVAAFTTQIGRMRMVAQQPASEARTGKLYKL